MSNPGWRPGHRRAPAGQNPKFGDDVWLLATVGRLSVMGVAQDPGELPPDPFNAGLTADSYGKNVVLLFRMNTGRNAFPVDLTALNKKELDTLEEVLKEALAHARPIVEERDRIAEEAAANGDDTYYRRHRVDPKVSRFPGKL